MTKAEPAEYLTIADLMEALNAYERVYQTSTEEFLCRYNDKSDSLEYIEDADLWYETWALWEELRRDPDEAALNQAGVAGEGSKEPSFICHEPRGLFYKCKGHHCRIKATASVLYPPDI